MIETKICYSCKQEKPVTDFYRSNVSYYQKECKLCNRDRKNKWHKTDSGKLSSANTKLKRRFGISLEDYNKMLHDQGGKCLVCGSTESFNGHKLAVDHDHTTGRVRGLLCKACNSALGLLKEDITNMENLIKYVEEYCK